MRAGMLRFPGTGLMLLASVLGMMLAPCGAFAQDDQRRKLTADAVQQAADGENGDSPPPQFRLMILDDSGHYEYSQKLRSRLEDAIPNGAIDYQLTKDTWEESSFSPAADLLDVDVLIVMTRHQFVSEQLRVRMYDCRRRIMLRDIDVAGSRIDPVEVVLDRVEWLFQKQIDRWKSTDRPQPILISPSLLATNAESFEGQLSTLGAALLLRIDDSPRWESLQIRLMDRLPWQRFALPDVRCDGCWQLDGEVQSVDGRDRLATRLISPTGTQTELISVPFDATRDDSFSLTADAVLRQIALISGEEPTAKEWDREVAAARHAGHARWAIEHGHAIEAALAADRAWALGDRSASVIEIRIRGYSMIACPMWRDFFFDDHDWSRGGGNVSMFPFSEIDLHSHLDHLRGAIHSVQLIPGLAARPLDLNVDFDRDFRVVGAQAMLAASRILNHHRTLGLEARRADDLETLQRGLRDAFRAMLPLPAHRYRSINFYRVCGCYIAWWYPEFPERFTAYRDYLFTARDFGIDSPKRFARNGDQSIINDHRPQFVPKPGEDIREHELAWCRFVKSRIAPDYDFATRATALALLASHNAKAFESDRSLTRIELDRDGARILNLDEEFTTWLPHTCEVFLKETRNEWFASTAAPSVFAILTEQYYPDADFVLEVLEEGTTLCPEMIQEQLRRDFDEFHAGRIADWLDRVESGQRPSPFEPVQLKFAIARIRETFEYNNPRFSRKSLQQQARDASNNRPPSPRLAERHAPASSPPTQPVPPLHAKFWSFETDKRWTWGEPRDYGQISHDGESLLFAVNDGIVRVIPGDVVAYEFTPYPADMWLRPNVLDDRQTVFSGKNCVTLNRDNGIIERWRMDGEKVERLHVPFHPSVLIPDAHGVIALRRGDTSSLTCGKEAFSNTGGAAAWISNDPDRNPELLYNSRRFPSNDPIEVEANWPTELFRLDDGSFLARTLWQHGRLQRVFCRPAGSTQWQQQFEIPFRDVPVLTMLQFDKRLAIAGRCRYSNVNYGEFAILDPQGTKVEHVLYRDAEGAGPEYQVFDLPARWTYQSLTASLPKGVSAQMRHWPPVIHLKSGLPPLLFLVGTKPGQEAGNPGKNPLLALEDSQHRFQHWEVVLDVPGDATGVTRMNNGILLTDVATSGNTDQPIFYPRFWFIPRSAFPAPYAAQQGSP